MAPKPKHHKFKHSCIYFSFSLHRYCYQTSSICPRWELFGRLRPFPGLARTWKGIMIQ
jgi:hypothetical protein